MRPKNGSNIFLQLALGIGFGLGWGLIAMWLPAASSPSVGFFRLCCWLALIQTGPLQTGATVRRKTHQLISWPKISPCWWYVKGAFWTCMSDLVWGLVYNTETFSFAGGALFSEVAWSPAMVPTWSTMMALAVSPPSFWPSLPWCSGGGDNIILFILNEPLTLKIIQLWRTLKGGLDWPQPSEQRLWENVDHPRADSFCSHWLWSSGDSKAVWIKTSQELRMLSRSLSDCQSTI